jgi:hypothetical protein
LAGAPRNGILSLKSTTTHNAKDRQLAKPNYEFQKRQKELAKKQKKEEKKLRKTLASEAPAAEEPPPAPADEKSPG